MRKGARIVKLGLIAVVVAVVAFSMSGCGTQEGKGTISVSGKSESDYPDLAKISITDVVNIAQAKFPGKVLSIELEEEKGYLVYEVEIVGTDRSINELKIDAGNGAVLSMEMKEAGKKTVKDAVKHQ